MSEIKGFGLANFRSYGSETQWFSQLKTVNLLIGPNNAGKSNALRFIGECLWPANEYKNKSGGYSSNHNDPPEIRSSALKASLFLNFPANQNHHLFKGIWNSLPSFDEASYITISKSPTEWVIDSEYLRDIMGRCEAQMLNQYLSDHSLGQNTTGSDAGFMENLSRFLWHLRESSSFSMAKAILIPDIREINRNPKESQPWEVIDGRHILKTLAEYERPPGGNAEKEAKFDKVSNFIKAVVNEPTLNLRPSFGGDELRVHINGVGRDLNDLGTGIRSLLIIAMAATFNSKRVICIEEPENHMHPNYQRSLIRFLQSTDNQYFIATHSAHFIDTPGLQIFHIQKEQESSTVRSVNTSTEKYSVCAALGYRASDLLQTNCIIWVEGPSDRIYLNAWLDTVSGGTLQEGRHYSIMYYSGSLGSHITAEDLVDETNGDLTEEGELPEPVKDLISLRRLNRNLAIMIDSDKRIGSQHLRPIKLRLQNEFNKPNEPGFAWITAGRTTENYYKEEDMLAATKAYHPDATVHSDEGTGQYTLHCMLKSSATGTIYDAKKVEIARHIVENYKPRNDLDHTPMMSKMYDFIKQANGMT